MAKRRGKSRGRGKKTVSIIVDGETEQWYAESMRATEQLRSLKIKPDLPKKKTLEALYDYVAKQAEIFDVVIWIVDMDVPVAEARKRGDLAAVMAKFKRKRTELVARGVTVIVNSPSLERWILLHYEDSKKYYSAQKPIIDRIRKHYLKAYEKSERYFKRKDGSLYQDLRPYLADALIRSKAMPAFDPDHPERAACEMWQLFEALDIEV